jgi:hypothetical protein
MKQSPMSKIREEYEQGTLNSPSGKRAKNEGQMTAIMHDETHPNGESHPHNVKKLHKHLKH